MSFDTAIHQQAMFDYYVERAQEPGWTDYVVYRVQCMARDCPELYRAFPEKLNRALSRIAREQAGGTKETRVNHAE